MRAPWAAGPGSAVGGPRPSIEAELETLFGELDSSADAFRSIVDELGE